MPCIKNLVLGSGGILGFAILGGLKYLEERGFYKKKELNNILGVSVGSVIGLLITLGFEIDEIIDLGMKLNFFKLINFNNSKFFSIIENFGYDNKKKFKNFLQVVITKKINNTDITFNELYELNGIDLTVLVSNANTVSGEYLNKDSKPNMKVYEAVYILLVFLLFYPHKLDNYCILMVK